MTRKAAAKRVMDVIVSLVLLALLSPLLLAVSILLAVAQGPPVFYRETRMGMHRRPFSILKFRTMRHDQDNGASVAPSDDPRITPVGALLKPSRLDELPQLINVLAGDMSLVGPRPLPPGHLATLEPAYVEDLLSARPGVTSPATVWFIAEDDVLAGSDDAERIYLDVILPAKVAGQLDYLHSWTFTGDFKVLLATVSCVWSKRAWRESRDMIRRLIEATDS